MRLWRCLFILGCALSGAVSAPAALTVSLSQEVQNSARGLEIVFSGTLANTSGTEKLFLNEIVPILSGTSASNLALKTNVFFANVPGVLLAGESYTNGELFRISLSGAASSGDYGGVVSFRGGTDIFTNAELATSAFTVLSPAVSVVATDASASEFGLDYGVLTIMRSGASSIDLPINFALSGTAVNGLGYQMVSPTTVIPAGSNSATVIIRPIGNDIAEGDRVASLSLGSSAAYNLAAPLSGDVIIHDKPADIWRIENFGANANTPAAADNGDWDGDGIQNLVEYALALDPKIADRTALPVTIITSGYLSISFVPNSTATDVNYIVESSTNLVEWGTADVTTVKASDGNPPGLLTFRYRFPVSQSEQAFLRLRVTLLPKSKTASSVGQGR